MKSIHVLRIAASACIVAGLLIHASPSLGQEAPPPPTAQHTTAGQRLATSIPAQLPPQTVQAPIHPTTMMALGDRREWERMQLPRVQKTSTFALAPSVQQDATPKTGNRALTFTPAFTAYLPLVTYSPGELYGNVTMSGTSAAGVSVLLRFYDGVTNTTFAMTTTDANGKYTFTNPPGLTTGQQYWVRYNNTESATDRLSVWITQIITTYQTGDHRAFSTFDIADVVMSAPAPYAVIAPPTVFTWTQRTASPSDSYSMKIFEPTGVYTSYYNSGLLGYTNTKPLAAVPAGMTLLTQYGWSIDVNSPEGGYGLSHYYFPVRFGKSGIQGRVTQNGVNISGITVKLYLQGTVGVPVYKGATTTNSDGIYQFISAASLTAGQKYYVMYSNTTNTSRLWTWYTDYITVYTAGQRAYAGNFDIANVSLVSPNGGSIFSPYTFTWVTRRAQPTETYFVEFMNSNYTLYASVDSIGHASGLSINSVPSGFSTNVSYGWDIGIYGTDGGIGISYQTFAFMFK